MTADLNLPLHQLSAYIHQATGMNFNDLLNKHRIIYCLKVIANGDMANLNLHGLALTCGFNNRNAFTTAFKKFTGKTPSEYLRNRRTMRLTINSGDHSGKFSYRLPAFPASLNKFA